MLLLPSQQRRPCWRWKRQGWWGVAASLLASSPQRRQGDGCDVTLLLRRQQRQLWRQRWQAVTAAMAMSYCSNGDVNDVPSQRR
jgi:hypothetical protein